MDTLAQKAESWLKLIRLQFYPMTFVAYAIGAIAARGNVRGVDPAVFFFGYSLLFMIEMATVVSNEYFDFNTDRANKNSSLFSGGSRMLVEGRISLKAARNFVLVVLGLICVTAAALPVLSPHVPVRSGAVLLVVGLFFGFGYTVPPVKFCYRGMGELVVGLTHSIYVLLCGYVLQGGGWGDPLPWLLSAPIFFATIAAIILAGLPDIEADRSAGKNTLPVLIGPRASVFAAMFFVLAAAACVKLLFMMKNGPILPRASGPVIALFAAGLVVALYRLILSGNYDRKINGTLALSLSYVSLYGFIILFGQILS